MQPHGSEGQGVWLLELHGVPYRQVVPIGTLIVTSGLGGVYPRGIPIGSVVGVASETGWERMYLVRPAVNTAVVSHVLIFTGSKSGGGGGADLRSAFADTAAVRVTP